MEMKKESTMIMLFFMDIRKHLFIFSHVFVVAIRLYGTDNGPRRMHVCKANHR